MNEVRKGQIGDVVVQGGVAIIAGIILFSTLFLPWLSTRTTAISGLMKAEDQAQIAIPMILIILAILMVFGGTIHVLGYDVGIQLVTVTSVFAFFISVMVIIVTLASSNSLEGRTLHLLIGPWIGAAGAIFGAISSKLERKQ